MQLMSVRKSDPVGENGVGENVKENVRRRRQEGVMSVETGSSYNGGQRSGHQAVA